MTQEVVLNDEQRQAMYALASVIAENNKKEQEAVKGYTEQLSVIQRVREVCGGLPGVDEALDALEAETQEKIADELNHSVSLNEEYQALTDIRAKED